MINKTQEKINNAILSGVAQDVLEFELLTKEEYSLLCELRRLQS